MNDKHPIDSIFDDFEDSGKSNPAIDNIFNSFDPVEDVSANGAAEAASKRTRASVKKSNPDAGTLGEVAKGVGSGIVDVGLTAGKAFYGLDELFGNKGSYDKYSEYLKKRNDELEQTAKPGFGIGRTIGQAVGTAPFIPAPAMEAANTLLPIARGAVKGAIAGGTFGGLTSAVNPDKSVGQNVLEGAATGGVLGPIGEAAIGASATLAGKAKGAWDTLLAAKAGNLDAGGAKAVIESLDAAGITPAQVRSELSRLGPKATLADIDPSLLAETEMLAKSGGTPTALIKSRFADRADQANYDTTHIINRNLGGNPDIDVLRERIDKDAQNATRQDYAVAHTAAGLDMQPTIDSIDEKLKTAVGPKANALNEIKSYFYKNAKDNNGEPISVLKDDLKSLHEIRTQLDTRINDKNPTTSYEKNALNAVKDIRANLDTELKTVPEMAAADAKYAQKMDVKNGIDIGQNIFDRKINSNQFAKEFNGASAEKQNIIREGIKSKVYDALEQATRGELSEAQKMFGKNTANREKFKLAFGQSGDEVLDALEKEANFRATEKTIEGGSRTGQIQALQQKYGIRPKSSGAITDIIHGAAADAMSGTGVLFTATQAGKRAIGGTRNYLLNNASEKKIAGAADILSRSGIARDNAVNTLEKIQAVRNRVSSYPKTQNLLGSVVRYGATPTSQYTTKQSGQ